MCTANLPACPNPEAFAAMVAPIHGAINRAFIIQPKLTIQLLTKGCDAYSNPPNPDARWRWTPKFRGPHASTNRIAAGNYPHHQRFELIVERVMQKGGFDHRSHRDTPSPLLFYASGPTKVTRCPLHYPTNGRGCVVPFWYRGQCSLPCRNGDVCILRGTVQVTSPMRILLSCFLIACLRRSCLGHE